MQQFNIGDHAFRANGLTPRKAFHVARRLAPFLAMLKDLSPFLKGTETLDKEDPASIEKVLRPIGAAFAEMPEDDADYILDTCLAVVELKLPGDAGWQSIWVAGEPMFAWIDMPMMLRIVWHVVQANVASFLSAGPPAG